MYERAYGDYIAKFKAYLEKDKDGNIIKEKSGSIITVIDKLGNVIQAFQMSLEAGHAYMSIFEQMGYMEVYNG